MTVICVTHTVANVEDFCHKISAAGNVITDRRSAPSDTSNSKLGDVYRKLAEAPGHEWRDRFHSSEELPALHRRAIGEVTLQ